MLILSQYFNVFVCFFSIIAFLCSDKYKIYKYNLKLELCLILHLE